MTHSMVTWIVSVAIMMLSSLVLAGSIHPGRMAPLTVVNFMLLGITLLLIDVETRRGYCPSEFLTFIIILAALYGLLDVAFLPQTAYVKMAVHTSVAFVMCALGLLCSRPDRGTMAIVTSDSSGAVLLRRVLPTVQWVWAWNCIAGTRTAENSLSTSC